MIDNYITKSMFMAFQKSPEKYKKMIEGRIEETEDMKTGTHIHNLYENLDNHIIIEDGELRIEKENIPSKIVGNETICEYNMIDHIEDFENSRYQAVQENPSMLYDPVTQEEYCNHHGLNIGGTPDAIFRDRNGFTVFELKMEKYGEHALELAFYRIIIEEYHNIDINKGVIFYASSNETEVVTDEDMKKYNIPDMVENMWNEIEENPNLPEPRQRFSDR